MRKLLLAILAVFALSALNGCRINVLRLDKRLDRWESLRAKGAGPEKLVPFARETIVLFLNNPDFQRTKEMVVTEAERLEYQQRLTDMQLYLAGYHADQALELSQGPAADWEAAHRQWELADSLLIGRVPGEPTVFYLVLIQKGYYTFLREISGDGERYAREEFRFPGLMEVLRRMSGFQFRLAGHLEEQGYRDQAIEHYLMVFKRDPQHYGPAFARVRELTGKSIREIEDELFFREQRDKVFLSFRRELYSMAEEQFQTKEQQSGISRDEAFPEVIEGVAKYYSITIEQAADLYLYTMHEQQGTLVQYLNHYRHDVLRGQHSADERYRP